MAENKIVLLSQLEQVKSFIEAEDAKQLKSAKDYTDALANGQVKTNKEAIDAINNTSTGILAEAKKYTDDEIDKVEATIGTVVEGETVVSMIADAKKAGTDANTALETYKTSNNTAVANNKKAIEDEVERATGKEGELNTAIGQVAADLTTLDNSLKAIAKSGTAADVAIVDEGGKITATNVETALAELADAISGASTAGVVTCEKTSPDGVAARYTFKQGGVEIPNAVVDIPKDMVVESGEVVTNPEGKPAGTYIVLTLANATEDKLYINVSDLIEYVTGGETDEVAVSVSAEHVATATIKKIAATKIVYKAAAGEQAEVSVAAALNDIYDQIGEGGSVAAQIEAAINELDVDDTQAADTDTVVYYVSRITETDGKIAPTFKSLTFATDAEIKAMFPVAE